MEEKQLIRLSKSGNNEALGKLYEKYFDAIYRFFYWQTNQNKESAEELTQETFFEMVKSIFKFKNKGKFKNWLYAIAKYKLKHWLRKKYQLPQTPLFENIINSEIWIDPDEQEKKVKQLETLITKLYEREQILIRLRYLKNYSVRETAQELKISEANVRVLAHRALIKLRKIAKNNLK